MIDVNYHSSIRIGDVYVDPYGIREKRSDAKYIFITHSHYDHLSFEDIDKVINKDTIIIGTQDVISEVSKKYKNGVLVVERDHEYELDDISFSTFPSYNISKPFHPLSNGWVGYVLNIGNVLYAIVGDSDLTSELKKVKCDVLFVPIGGTYTMNAREASELTNIIRPRLVIPVHYNAIVGNKNDEKEFIDGLKNIEYEVYL